LSIRDILALNISGKKELMLFTLNKDSCSISQKITRILRRKFLCYLFKGFTIAPQLVEPEKYLIRPKMKLSAYGPIRGFGVEI
jgi:hypothetical protein